VRAARKTEEVLRVFDSNGTGPSRKLGTLDSAVGFFLGNRLLVWLIVVLIVSWGVMVAPFDWKMGGLPRSPVPVDAIPDIGENQQIVFTEWMGRSPQNVEDQITYPLTVSLLGVPGVRTVRSFSFFGFSSIYVIFEDGVDFYWSRTRILERLSSLPSGALPEGARPTLGPDATALGQVFWYTLEGRDERGEPAGGWDPQELRSVQDWQVRYALMSAGGVAEVASVGGFEREYQIDVDPSAMRALGVTLEEILSAVRMSNLDVGARTIEVNRVEYVIRGLGFVERIEDLESVVVRSEGGTPIRVRDVATVSSGPGARRGALDKGGAEAVGGVVVVRHGANPLATIGNVKEKINEISPGLPAKTLPDGTVSRVTVVPFYDRTELIHETLGTLNRALFLEILVTAIVVIVIVMHLGGSMLISGILPLVVLMCFIAMKTFRVDANVIALSGIAIAIGTIVDMGIILTENIIRHLGKATPGADTRAIVAEATSEVSGAVLTAISTTVVSFLPVFAMEGAEGKLFRPLAYTKTFALVSSAFVALIIIPPLAHMVLARRTARAHGDSPSWSRPWRSRMGNGVLVAAGLVAAIATTWWAGLMLALVGVQGLFRARIQTRFPRMAPHLPLILVGLLATLTLTRFWLPLGPERGTYPNFAFVVFVLGVLLGFFLVFMRYYERMLGWCLAHKVQFIAVPAAVVAFGAIAWLGFDTVFGFVPTALSKLGVPPERIRSSAVWSGPSHAMPGFGREFMPPLDEGSFLWMPTTMPHASIGEALDILAKQDRAIGAIPEVSGVVGKIGRVDSALDPAPISMIETVIDYKSEYVTDERGRRLLFRYDAGRGEFARDEFGDLIPNERGRPYRQWRDHIKSPDDIWAEIAGAARIPGTTSAPKLQPIETRLVMLQSGMRAPMGVKIKGPDLETIERVGLEIERFLGHVPAVEPGTVFADRMVGKPYIEIDIDREAIARHGMHVARVANVIETAIGGKQVTTTIEGRERYAVRVRYARELRDRIEALGDVLVAAPGGTHIPLKELSEIRYVRGPQAIKSEDTFLVGYVTFGKRQGYAEVDAVEMCREYLNSMIEAGELMVPAGVSFRFAGSYENQLRAQKKLSLILPLALLVIFMILYLQFRSTATTLIVFSGIVVAWAGGFILIWLYGKPWFLDFTMMGASMRELFQIHPVNLSVAVWVGFLALFGISSDNGVVLATYIDRTCAARPMTGPADVREATIEGATRRIRPCLMTSATTILALLPVLTSTGRGADVMIPMAIPSFGGMLVVLLSVFVVPVLLSWVRERRLSVDSVGGTQRTELGRSA
jgi:Cu(I)/Ag(I) efflux system membrane protein CusA/SilA